MSQQKEQTSFPCPHPNYLDCNCLSKEMENQVYRLHLNNQNTTCVNSQHASWGKQSTWHLVTSKPAWKESCQVPYQQDEEKQIKLLKLAKIFNLTCTCKTSGKSCSYCWGFQFETKRLAVGGTDGERWSMNKLWLLDHYIKWDLISLQD